MKQILKIPFDYDGNQVTSYTEYQISDNCRPSLKITLVDNYEFETILKYSGYERGRSALNIVWVDENGIEYRSSMKLLDDVMNGNYPFLKVDNRLAIQGKFTFKKQGSSILLKLVDDK